MRGSDLLARCLENEGVQRIFGIPGEENLEFMDSLVDSDIEFVLTRHESSAAFMATVAARIGLRAEVCLSTLGPGATNMITGVGEAYLTYAPVIALTGQVETAQAHPPRKQYLDLVSLFGPVTKSSSTVRRAEGIPGAVRRSFRIAMEERPGPVHLELPQDVSREETDASPINLPPKLMPDAEANDVSAVRERIERAERPLVLVGQGVVRDGASQALREFCREANIPAMHTWMGNGVIPFDDPLSLHTVGLSTQTASLRAFEEADLVITVGFDAVEFQPRHWDRGAEVVNVSLHPPDPGYSPTASAVGDIASTLASFSDIPRKERWTDELRVNILEEMEGLPEGSRGLSPQAAVRAINDSLGKEDIAVVDVGAHLLWMAGLYHSYGENTLILSNGLISMGMGIPGAIGAKFARPDRDVVAVCGDGGAMMSIAELETAVRTGTDIVVVILNDSSLGLIKAKQERRFGRTLGVDMGPIDLVKVAEGLGAKGHRVEDAEGLREVLRLSLMEGGTALIDVPIDGGLNASLLG